MDPQGHNRNRSVSSAGHQDLSINSEGTTSPLPSSTTFAVASSAATSMSLSVGIDPQSTQVQDQNFFITPPYLDQTSVDPSLQFTQAGKSTTLNTTDYTDSDFSLFPTGVTGSENNFDQPLFDQSLNSDITSPQINTSSPTSAGLLKPEPHASPAMLQNQFSSPPGGHSRNASLGPQDALLISQDWTGMSFQTHRRSPSEFSDRSSVHSPHLTTNDTFDTSLDGSGHSPLQRPIDNPMYQDMNMRIGNFTLSEQPSPNMVPGHSPSHSPAMSPQMMPAPMSADLNPPVGFGMMSTGQFVFGGMTTQETFPTLQSQAMPTMAPPAINIQLAPSSKEFDSGQTLNSSSLTPPERGRTRPRSVTDPYNASLRAGNTLSPNLAASMSRENSRPGSPSSRGSSISSTRRRQSTSSVPNNVMALRLADPEYQNSSESGNARRVQKHPATFQCTLCPKRFTRAYNLRSHLRTHTDERPFVCTVCGKAFARQHDRKRHESLHSGEKKFVCKGDLKTGGQWGCSRRFARADALGRHFRSEAGRVCIKPLLDEEALERQRTWQEQQMAQNMSQGMAPQMTFGPDGYPMDPSGGYALPQALLAQYPALAQMNWGQPGPAIEEDLSGRSSFEASDYDGEGDDGGYVSGAGTGFGDGSMGQNFGDLNYTSDFAQTGR